MSSKYRSLLFVPATEKLLPKIEGSKADAVIIDLEDAIQENDKEPALDRLEEFLKTYLYDIDLFVRVNRHYENEAARLDRYGIKGYMLPKSESAADIEQIASAAPGKLIIALIETARGVLNAEDIAKSKAVTMLAFGAEDYTTECGIENRNEFLSYPKGRLVACAKAYGKPVIDTISLNVRNRDSYSIEAEQSKAFGFDGKLAIHPMQVDVINGVFNDDYEQMKRIVSEYDTLGQGVVEINGRLYEKPHIDAMRRKITGRQ